MAKRNRKISGEKITIPESEIAKLDSHENRFWRKDYLDMVHTREQIIPKKYRKKIEETHTIGPVGRL